MAHEKRPDKAEPGNAARPASLRDRKRARIKRMLQAEALRLFAEKGYQGTTVEDIADAAAISPRTFFRYFPSKEDVVVWDEQDLLTPQFWDPRPADEPVAESVRAFFRQALKGLHDQDRDRQLARLRLIFTVPEIRARYWSDQAGNPPVISSWLAGRHPARRPAGARRVPGHHVRGGRGPRPLAGRRRQGRHSRPVRRGGRRSRRGDAGPAASSAHRRVAADTWREGRRYPVGPAPRLRRRVGTGRRRRHPPAAAGADRPTHNG